MCRSISEGGQRCAAHTRPAYDNLMSELKAVTGFGAPQRRKNIRNTFRHDDRNATNVIADYASTPTGKKHIERDVEAFADDPHTVAALKTGLRIGAARTDACKETAKEIRRQNAQETGWRKGPGGGYEWMAPSTTLTPGESIADRFPEVLRYWRPEDNPHRIPRFDGDMEPETGDPVSAHQVTSGSNAELFWRCEEEGHLNRGRVNTFRNRLSEGRKPICPQCQPGRSARFKRVQEEDLNQLVAALGDDPSAFETLSPALRFSLLSRMGMTGSGAHQVQRDLAMNMVHGDVTLKDVVTANTFMEVEKQLRDLNDEDELHTVSELDGSPVGESDPPQQVSQVMKAAGVLALVEQDPDLSAAIVRENVEALWAQACKPDTDLAALRAQVHAHRDDSPYAALLADRFTAELDHATNAPLPAGYQPERTLGEVSTTIDPTLMQRRFMVMTQERRRLMNYSGTGAGKTTAAVLAVQNTGARETLIVCPKAVIGQWQEEFNAAFPANTDVRIGLPTGAEPPPPHGINRVWVANYDKFQTADQGNLERLSSGQLDAVVFDEIHFAKKTDEASASNRNRALEHFTDQAATNNPNLVVIGASATPVVNNLEEARSVLRLVEGPDSASFPTAPTIKNAAAAYHRLSAAGIRHRPTYPTAMTRTDVTVDVTDTLGTINASVEALRKRSRTGRVNPAMMERALLPAKLPAIVSAVKSSPTPSIVYTDYTSGMVNPMREALESEGLRVATYTGEQNRTEHQQVISDFKSGKVDVIIGSRPIATGVDGLQHVSANLVIASMPWTAAGDDQLVGRLHRHGQTRDVNVTYVMTEAKVGKARWSWCKDVRQRRIQFKRSIADAAVDGIIPDGILDSKDDGAGQSLAGLAALLKKSKKGRSATAA